MAEQALPTGRVTLLFTDIEGSTRLLEALGERFGDLVADHRLILREAVARHGGTEVGTQGDGHTAVFAEPVAAILAAVDAQHAFARRDWPDDLPVRVRMGLHTGDVSLSRDEYYGMGLHAAARVSSAAHGGQILVSEDAFAVVHDRLPRDYGLMDLGPHSLKDLGAPRRLYQLTHATLEREFPPPASLNVLPNNLPTALSTFIGREKEIVDIVRLLEANRLVTVIGPGGVGKTRTSLQAAAHLVDAYEHGVWFVDLAAAKGSVAQAIASALLMRDEPGRSLVQTLEEKLRWREALLVIDNCEHVIEECAELIALVLGACANVRVLATSRESLRVPGEMVRVLEPLEIAAGADETAVRLFIERAASSASTWTLRDADLPHIEEICRRVDGLPLGIELAAARTDVLSVEQIEQRLRDPSFLSGGARGIPQRQRSLEALIEWSHDLLSPLHRVAFRRTGVFVGGFTLEAAVAVCGGEGIDVVEALTSLVRSSLVVAVRRDGAIRYRLLETIRAFALGRLEEAGELASVAEAHRDHYADVAVRARPELDRADQARWLDSLTDELGNLTTAIEWTIANAEPDGAVAMIDALRRFWIERGHMHTALAWLRELDGAIEPTSLVIGELFANRGFLEGIVGDGEQAFASLTRARQIAAERDDPILRERVSSNLGTLHERRGDLDAAEALYAEAAELAAAARDLLAEGSAIGNLGNVAYHRGDLARAEELHIRALELARQAGAQRVVANTYNNLGLVAWVRGDLSLASERFGAAIAIARELGTSGLPFVLGNLAGVARDLGETSRALKVQEEAVGLAEQAGDPAALASGLVSLGTIRWDAGDRLGAVEAWTHSLEVARASGAANEELSALLNLAQFALDTDDIDGARTRGTELLEIAKRGGTRRRIADGQTILATVANRSGDPHEAERLAREAVAIVEDIGDLGGVTDAVSALAEALAAKGDLTGAFAVLADIEERLHGHEGWLVAQALCRHAQIALRAGDLATAAEVAERLEALDGLPASTDAERQRVLADVRASAD